jgi:hypothetical protein
MLRPVHLVFLGLTFAVEIPTLAGEFRSLAAGQTIEVSYQSSGCWHSYHYEFVFRPAGRAVEVAVTSVDRQPAKPGEIAQVKREAVGTATLNRTQVDGLDRLMNHYRTRARRGGCTTEDRVSLRLKSGRRTLSNASFVDSTCSVYRGRITTLAEVVDLVRAAQPQK